MDDKSNEIIAMPQLMDALDLKGTIITADAMNTQKATANKAIDGEADRYHLHNVGFFRRKLCLRLCFIMFLASRKSNTLPLMSEQRAQIFS